MTYDELKHTMAGQLLRVSAEDKTTLEIATYYYPQRNFSYSTNVVGAGVNQSLMEEPTMSDSEGIPATLSLMQTMFADEDDKALIRAKFLADGELTSAGKSALALINYKANKAALVELAKTLIANAAANKN